MVNVCIGALALLAEPSGSAGGLPAASARPPLSPSPAHPRLFSCSEECESPENTSVFEKSLSRPNTGCVEESKYSSDTISEAQKIRPLSTFLNSSIFFINHHFLFLLDPHHLCKGKFGLV